MADAGGQYTYERTFTISDELAANVTNAAIVLHGDDRNGNGVYDGHAPSSIDPDLPLEATTPVACGLVSLQNTFTSVNPARILDTRGGTGMAGSASTIGPDATIDLQVAGNGGVPSTGVVAVAMNVTSTLADSRSFITAFPTGTARPTTSNLNVAPGVDTPNQAIVGLGSDGKASMCNEAGNGHLVADVTGYFLGGSGLEPVNPARLLDTRNDIGVTTGIVGPDSTISFDAAGLAGVPAEGIDSVVLNVTATGSSERGWATVYPGGTNRPEASTVNLEPPLDTPNMAIVKVGSDGMIDLYNFIGESHYVVDVFGYFPDDVAFSGLNPSRILDTRAGTGAPAAMVGPDGTIELDVTGIAAAATDGVIADPRSLGCDRRRDCRATPTPSGMTTHGPIGPSLRRDLPRKTCPPAAQPARWR